MNKFESFVYACLPALLILVFSEVAVFLADGKTLTMILLGLFYLILIWWLYMYTQGKIMMKVIETEEKEQDDEPEE
jgi:hypothetical protein